MASRRKWTQRGEGGSEYYSSKSLAKKDAHFQREYNMVNARVVKKADGYVVMVQRNPDKERKRREEVAAWQKKEEQERKRDTDVFGIHDPIGSGLNRYYNRRLF